MTPRCTGLACSVPRYLPTFGGASHVLRVRSGLMRVQVWPPSRVFHSVLEAKYRVRGSVGANTSGCVRIVR